MSSNFTLRDLVAESHLGLEVVAGSPESLERSLCGAHAIETDNPSQTLEPGWLMLTMGTRLRNKPNEQRRLVAELQALGAAALGFGTGLAFKSVPPALLDEAAKRDFPVVVVRVETSFQEISRVVFQSTMIDEAQTYRRLTTLQHNLMRAFADTDPVMSTLRRLSRFSNCVAAVVSADGRVHATTAALPFGDIVRLIQERPVLAQQRTSDGWEFVSAPLSTWQSDQPVSLVLANRPTAVASSSTRTMLDVAVPIFEALGRLTIANRRHDEALSRALIENALNKKLSDVEASQFEEHLESAGMPVNDGVTCAILRSPQQPNLLDACETALRSSHTTLRVLFSRRPDHLVLLMPSSQASVTELSAFFGPVRFGDLRTGIGRGVTSAQDLAVSQRDASIVLQFLEREGGCAALTFDDLDLASQLMAEVAPERVAAKVQVIMDLLERQPIQLEAVRAYFDTCLDVQAAARRIYVHPNTLRYRLERFETALGRSLRDPSMIASLHYVLSLIPPAVEHADGTGLAARSG